MSVMMRGNEALSLNPLSAVADALSLEGSNWLWAVMAIYIISFVRP